MSAQHCVRVLLRPEVVKLGLCSRGRRGWIQPILMACTMRETFSFSTRDGMKLRLSAGRLVTGWIIRSPLKKSTAGS